MTVGEVVEKLSLSILAGQNLLQRQVEGGYVSDLLSNVMAGAKENQLWVTVQLHSNVVAVAALLNISAIIIAGNKQPGPETITKADDQGVILLLSEENAFEVVCRLHDLGIGS